MSVTPLLVAKLVPVAKNLLHLSFEVETIDHRNRDFLLAQRSHEASRAAVCGLAQRRDRGIQGGVKNQIWRLVSKRAFDVIRQQGNQIDQWRAFVFADTLRDQRAHATRPGRVHGAVLLVARHGAFLQAGAIAVVAPVAFNQFRFNDGAIAFSIK
jgi:hypothetical protein